MVTHACRAVQGQAHRCCDALGTVLPSCLLLLGNSLLFLGHPLNSAIPQYSPDSHLCGPFSFPGRKAQNNDGSGPLTSHSLGITHTSWQQLVTNMTFACHSHPSSGSLAPSSPSLPHPNAGPRSTAHLGLTLTSLWPVQLAFSGGGSPFWASASPLCNVGTKGVD